jgi:hypothetical protein
MTKGEVDNGEGGCCVQGWDDIWWRDDKRNEASIIQGSGRKRKCIWISQTRCRDSYFYGRVMGIFTQAVRLSFA